jgi:hypothetical protein
MERHETIKGHKLFGLIQKMQRYDVSCKEHNSYYETAALSGTGASFRSILASPFAGVPHIA